MKTCDECSIENDPSMMLDCTEERYSREQEERIEIARWLCSECGHLKAVDFSKSGRRKAMVFVMEKSKLSIFYMHGFAKTFLDFSEPCLDHFKGQEIPAFTLTGEITKNGRTATLELKDEDFIYETQL